MEDRAEDVVKDRAVLTWRCSRYFSLVALLGSFSLQNTQLTILPICKLKEGQYRGS